MGAFETFVNANLGIRKPLILDVGHPTGSTKAAGVVGSEYIDTSNNFIYEKTGENNQEDWRFVRKLGEFSDTIENISGSLSQQISSVSENTVCAQLNLPTGVDTVTLRYDEINSSLNFSDPPHVFVNLKSSGGFPNFYALSTYDVDEQSFKVGFSNEILDEDLSLEIMIKGYGGSSITSSASSAGGSTEGSTGGSTQGSSAAAFTNSFYLDKAQGVPVNTTGMKTSPFAINGPFTISLWFQVSQQMIDTLSGSSGFGPLLFGTGSNTGRALSMYNGYIYSHVTQQYISLAPSDNPNFWVLGTWHHLVIVNDEVTQKYYIDGVHLHNGLANVGGNITENEAAWNYHVQTASPAFHVNGLYSGFGNDGGIDEFSIFNYAISDIKLLGENGVAKDLNLLDVKPYVWWRFGDYAQGVVDGDEVITVPNAGTGPIPTNGGLANHQSYDLSKPAPNTGGLTTVAPFVYKQYSEVGSISFPNSYSLEFNENTDFVELGDTKANGNNTFHFGTSPFSLSVWIKPSALSGNDQIFGAHLGSFGWTMYSSGSAGTGSFFFFSGLGNLEGGSITMGVWNHLVVTRDGAALNMYVNKSKTSYTVNALALVNTNESTTTRLAHNGGTLASLLGVIDEAAAWNVALTDADVAALFDNGPNNLNAAESYDTDRSNNLLAWYRNGDTGTDAFGTTKVTNAATGSASAGSSVDGTISGPSFVTETPSAGSEFDELHYDGGIYSDSASRYYIGTSPILHVDSKIVDGVTADNNPSNASSVSTWRDRSGNSNDLIQSTASKQMAYDTSTSPNSLVSDGGDFFNLTDEIAFLTSSALTQIFISADLNSGGGNNTFISGLTKSPGLNADLILFAGSTAGSGTELKIAGNHTEHGASVPSTTTSPALHVLTKNGNTHKYWFNGGSPHATQTRSFGGPTKTFDTAFLKYVDAGGPGRVFELIVFQTELSISDLNIIKDYVNNKYSLSIPSFS